MTLWVTFAHTPRQALAIPHWLLAAVAADTPVLCMSVRGPVITLAGVVGDRLALCCVLCATRIGAHLVTETTRSLERLVGLCPFGHADLERLLALASEHAKGLEEVGGVGLQHLGEPRLVRYRATEGPHLDLQARPVPGLGMARE